MPAADTRPPLCGWLKNNYAERLREVMRRTEQTATEHGFVILGEPGDLRTTPLISGSARSIDVANHTTTEFRPTRVTVHSHPSGSIVPSDADWRGFLTEIGQYGPDNEFPAGWRRGSAVIGKRLGEEDKFGLRSLELTEAGIGLSAMEQREWVSDAFDVFGSTRVGALGSTQDIADEVGPQVRTCATTVQQ